MKQFFILILLLCLLPSANATNPKLDAALVKAIDYGDMTQIRKLVVRGANINARNGIGQTVLERASQYGNYNNVKILLDLGANVNSTSNYGGPLASASKDLYGNSAVAVCRLLLSRGANPDGQPGKETPLVAALREAVGAEDNIGSLVTGFAVAVSTSDHSPAGQQRAIALGKAEEIKMRQSFVKTEHQQVIKTHEAGLQIVRLLIAKGANVNLNSYGSAPLMAAAQAGSVEAISILIDSGAKADKASLDAALGPAAASGSASSVAFLLARGASPNAVGIQQSPAITLAALSDAAEVIRVLVNAGADVNARGVDEETALNLVMLRADVPAVKFLLAHGADPNIADKDGKTPLYWAKEAKSVELVTLLEDAGAK